jgi:hypothetical protein
VFQNQSFHSIDLVVGRHVRRSIFVKYHPFCMLEENCGNLPATFPDSGVNKHSSDRVGKFVGRT